MIPLALPPDRVPVNLPLKQNTELLRIKLPLLSTGHLSKLFSPFSPLSLGHGDNPAHHVRLTGASNVFKHAKDICGIWDPGNTLVLLAFAVGSLA